jgi:hypothetical protein
MTLDRFEIFGWLRVYFRQVAKQSGFAAKSAVDQWSALRAHVLADSPPSDELRRSAIDGVQESEREEVLAWLERTTKPATAAKLTMLASAHFHPTAALTPDDKPIMYDVQGLPSDTKIRIADIHHRWQILRIENDVAGEWHGAYQTAEDALASLQDEFAN